MEGVQGAVDEYESEPKPAVVCVLWRRVSGSRDGGGGGGGGTMRAVRESV